jgi:hypothetical protein
VKSEVAQGTPLEQLRELVLAEGGELAGAMVAEPGPEAFAPLLAASERCADRVDDYGLMIESICEGYLVHYGSPRLVDPADENLRLLAGDYLYALGLERLAWRGDLEAVRELADLISLSAQVHAENGEQSAELVGALWLASTVVVAVGSSDEHESAKDSLRRGDPDAARRLSRNAAEIAARAGIGDALARAAEAVGFGAGDVPNRG